MSEPLFPPGCAGPPGGVGPAAPPAPAIAQHPPMSARADGQLWLLPRAGTAAHGRVAEVVVALRSRQTRTYGVPAELHERVRPGVLVRVPARRRGTWLEGLCVRVSDAPWDHTRMALAEVSGEVSWLSSSLIELGLWLGEYYCASLWTTFEALAPPALRRQELRDITYVRRRVAPDAPVDTSAAEASAARGTEHGAPNAVHAVGGAHARRHNRADEAHADNPAAGAIPGGPRRLTSKQLRILDRLGDQAVAKRVLQTDAGAGPSALRSLERRGLIEIFTQRETPPPVAPVSTAEPSLEDDFTLTPNQAAALAAIAAAIAPAAESAVQAAPARERSAALAATLVGETRFRTFVLFGVPGSGKTEVYVRAMRTALAHGRQAILLIPEIALATQVVQRLARRFARVAVLHSQLSSAIRRRTLSAIAAGLVDVVIGTRTAVFAPCPRLGLILVDEEQEGSFKNLATPYYHARDVAIKRAQLEGIPVVLGSATPSLETWHNARTLPHYQLLRLSERAAGAVLPQTRIAQHESNEARLLSPLLVEELRRTLEDGQQAILLHNRRGYAVYLRCERCELLVSCPRCQAALVEHRAAGQMKCHQCQARMPIPTHCLDNTCRGKLAHAGLAVQRLEEELLRKFPAARLLRLDADTMRKRADYERALQRFERREADILLGTQMVAKGLDFPAVRLAGVIDADGGLALPDFRAGERVFQLVMQVIGRAGRSAGDSLAVVQCRDFRAAAIRHALRLDYESFAGEELFERHKFALPPFTRLARIVLADSSGATVREEAERVAAALGQLAGRISADLRVDPPGPCVIARRRELFRYLILLRAPRAATLGALLKAAEAEKLLYPRVARATIDVDPVDLL